MRLVWCHPDDERDAARLAGHRSAARLRLRRTAVRSILAHYVGCDVAEVSITRSSNGKPTLNAPRIPFEFSATRTRGFALCAVARAPLGIDAEYRRCLPDAGLLASRILTEGEYAAWQDVAPAIRAERILSAWTRKEAVLKALGVGLRVPPNVIEVGWAPRSTIRWERLAAEYVLTARMMPLWLGDVTTRAELVVALATKECPSAIRVRNWHSPAEPALDKFRDRQL